MVVEKFILGDLRMEMVLRLIKMFLTCVKDTYITLILVKVPDEILFAGIIESMQK